VEIPFRGAGWVYLGELSSRRGLAYDSRRLDPEGQSFIFRCETPGTYVLKFYRQDFIRDYILNDHVQVIVGEAPESSGIGLFNPPVDRGRMIAEPRWPPLDREREGLSQEPRAGPAEEEEAAAWTAPPEASGESASGGASPPQEAAGGLPPGAVPENARSTEEADIFEDSLPGGYVSRALEEYNAGRIVQALAVMDRFLRRFPSGTDEAWWLLGQLLEANSPARDVALALEYYRRLVREFPQSQRVPAAQRRIAYLERYYFNIR
jgi:tetratricopeptide (TPR) repeat protein